MKKMVVLTALMLSCFLAFSQEADDTAAGVGLTVIPRLDLNPQFSTEKGGDGDFTLGNSSLYSLFEGDISDHFSFSVENHWLAVDVDDFGGTAKALYENTWHSDDVNWLDWAYLTYSAGNFAFTFGKDMITTGGMEFDEYDFDVHYDFASGLWNNLAPYQWGVKAAYTTPDEGSEFSLQVTTSPYGEKPFSSNLYTYSLGWRGEYGPVSTIWNLTCLESDADITSSSSKDYTWLLSLGQRLDLDPFSISVDYFNKVGDEEEILAKGHTVFATATYTPRDNMEVLLRGGYETTDNYDTTIIGGAFHWYPLENLRLHAVAAYNNSYDIFSLTFGAVWYINLL